MRNRISTSTSVVAQLTFAAVLATPQVAVPDDARIELDIKYGMAVQAAELATLEKLSKPVTVEWDDIAFTAAVKQIGREQALNVVLDELELKTRGLNPDGNVNLLAADVPLREVLDQLCLSLGRDAAWLVKGSFVIFTLRDIADRNAFTRVYDVSKLLPKSDKPFRNPFIHGSVGFSDIPSDQTESNKGADTPPTEPQQTEAEFLKSDYYEFSELIAVLEDTTGRDSWQSLGGEGIISPLVVGETPLFVIQQTREVHLEIATLLSQLEEFAKEDQE